uniref:replication initiation protein RepM n=1 Tax=Psychrobacter sp. TaxID=56811 RepID=UPI00159906D3|nr:replication initiation protein RepM [Psychrobacter sp.]QJS05200.1 replication protein RepB [Psychrobacter sp.]
MTKKQMVVKDNNLISATYSLGVAEQRLIFLAIIEAREQNKLINVGKSLRIYAKSYEKQFNVEKHTAYEAMKRAVEGLYEAGFAYSKTDEESGELGHYKSRWVDKIGYIDNLGCVELVFASDVVPLITRLERRYTEYELKQVSSLQSEYAIRLYELIIQWKSIGKTNKILLNDLRTMLGVDPEQYKKMCNFKAKVLDLAIKQINKYTDITADYEQHKDGRVITGFTFKFKVRKDKEKITTENKKRDVDTSDMFTVEGLNDAQLGRIARNPSFMADYNHLVSSTSPAGQDTKAWEFEMINRLKIDASQFKKRPIREYLQ